MKTKKTLVCATFALALLGNASAAATASQTPATVFGLAGLAPEVALQNGQDNFEIVEARLTREERRARRAERRARRAERRAARNNDAPFGRLSDGTPRSQPITRSDRRLQENGGQLRAANSFSNLNNPDAR